MSSWFHVSRSRALLAAALLSTAAASAAQFADSEVLSLPEALQRSSSKNPSLLANTAQVRAAEARIEQAGLRPNPTLDFSIENIAGTGTVQGVQRLEATVQATQVLERGRKRDRRLALAGREHEAVEKAAAVRRSEVLASTANAYVNVLAAQQRLELSTEPLRLARETLEAVELRVKSGVASPADISRARAGLAAAEADIARTEASLGHARLMLARLWGSQPAEIPALQGGLHVPQTLPQREQAQARLSTHPRLVHQQALIAGQRAALALEQAQAVQDISVGGGLRLLREGSDAALVAGVSIPLPVRNRNQGNIRAARELLAGAELAAREIEAELNAEFTSAWQDLQAAQAAASNLREHALPPTEEALRLVRSAYEQGLVPLLDVFDAQRAVLSLRTELLNAQADYALALARIDALTDPDFTSLNALLSNR